MMIGGLRASYNGGEKCGDAFAWWRDERRWTILLVDGLGHGEQAAMAADAALAHAEANRALSPNRLLEAIDKGIDWSRGAAIAIVRVDEGLRTLCYLGVGNVRAAVFGDKSSRFDGTPGIVGAGCRSARLETLSWTNGDLLVLWTDGLNANLSIDQASLRLKGDPESLAQRLIGRFTTGRDDVGVVCCLLEGVDP